ncbi:MAG: hypothetical protein AAF725_24965, partial [Acidobacteriota bacterium]
MSRSRSIIFVSALLLLAVGAQAQVAPSALNIPGSTAASGSPGIAGTCSINNLQGMLASGFLSFNAPGGGHALFVDPEASGGASDPGCGFGDFEVEDFRIDNIVIDIADASAFAAGTGMGMATYSITVHDLATPGDSCGGPGAVLFDTGPLDLTMTAAGQYFPTIPIGITVSGPFFVQWNLLSLSNVNETISPLWDGVARPLCRQFVTQDSGVMYQDHNDFFTNGTVGWLDIITNGEFVERGTGGGGEFPTEVDVAVPTASTYGLIALGLLLAGFGF